MTKKRYKKLMRAFMTDIHTYSKLIEGRTAFDGTIHKRTSLKREVIDRVQPDWDRFDSYEEAWEGIEGVWEVMKKQIAIEKEKRS